MDIGFLTAAAFSALRDQVPAVSPLDGIGVTEGRVDVLASRALQRMAHSVGDPALAALYEKARPMVDTVIMQSVGPRRVRR